MNPDIKKIIEAAIMAPSGENCQPWRFAVVENEIKLFNHPESDQSLYNYDQRASMVANGAALENMVIAASALGYLPEVKLFPDAGDANYIASLSLQKGLAKPDLLSPFIVKRVTNRKPYQTAPIEEAKLAALVGLGAQTGFGQVVITQDGPAKAKLAAAGATNERVMLSNKHLHQFFFSHVNWTKAEDDQKRMGFYIETLELPPPAKIAFRVFKHWNLFKILNKLNLAKAIGKQNAAGYAQSAAIGGIVIDNNSPASLVNAGRLMERFWLTVTELGLSLQPMTGVLFFMQAISSGYTEKFSAEQLRLIKSAYADIETAFSAQGKTIAMMFRLGYAEPPTAQASRYPLEHFLK